MRKRENKTLILFPLKWVEKIAYLNPPLSFFLQVPTNTCFSYKWTPPLKKSITIRSFLTKIHEIHVAYACSTHFYDTHDLIIS